MQPLAPPPVNDSGATTLPRMLQKWLDVNPITALTRTASFITLPTFNVPYTFAGYSDIVAAFNFEAPNSFSLQGVSMTVNGITFLVPINMLLQVITGNSNNLPNYLLAISWNNQNGQEFRYALWSGVGEIFYFPVAAYTGQVIQKNFRLEIWSVGNQTAATNTITQSLYTSVLGGLDYRWSQDMALIGNDGIVTNFAFSSTGTGTNAPNTTSATDIFQNWFRADTGVAGIAWTPKQGTGVINSSGLIAGQNIVTQNVPNLQNLPVVEQGGSNLTGTASGVNSGDIWMLFEYMIDGTIFTLKNGAITISQLSIANGIFTVDGTQLNPHNPITNNQYYVIEWFRVGSGAQQAGIAIWAMSQLTLPFASVVYYAPSNNRLGTNSFIIGGASPATMAIAELLIYAGGALDPVVQSTNLSYFINRYNSYYTLPITFPLNAVSTVNNTTYLPPGTPIFINGYFIYISGSGGAMGAG